MSDDDPRLRPALELTAAVDVPQQGRSVEDMACDHVDAQRALAAMDRRTAAIVAERVGLGIPLDDVAARHGVTGSRICQLTTRDLRTAVA